MKSFIKGAGILSALLLSIVLSAMPVRAEGGNPYIALGQDLSEEQKNKVLSIFGIYEKDLANCTVVYVTNDQEHEYLKNYVPDEVIGTRSLSSVMVTPAVKGSGIRVTTHNINYCTVSMYKNALLTAGVEDAEVVVAAPTQISGTAALIGAMKAYEQMSGETIGEDRKDTAVEEIVTIGELMEGTGTAASTEAAVNTSTGEVISEEQMEEIFGYIKAKVVAEGLTDPQRIRELVEEAQTLYDVTLTDSQKQKIESLMPSIGKLDIDPGKLMEQAGDLYDRYGETALAHAKELYSEVMTEEVKQSIWTAVGTFFKSLFNVVRDKITNH